MVSAETLVGLRFDSFLEDIHARYENVDVVTTRIAGRTYATVSDLGFSLVSEDADLIDTVQVHGEGSGYGPPALLLPWGLSMSDSRVTARSRLGSPAKTGGGDLNPLTGRPIRTWDLFAVHGFRCHLEYLSNDAGIGLLSIGPLPN